MSRSFLIMMALSGALVAGAAGAQVVDPNDRLAGNDAKFIQDWVTKNRIDYVTTSPVATWQYVGATAGGVAWRAVLDEKHGLAGSGATVGLRLEPFAPVAGVGGMQTLSELAAFDVDCGKNRIKHTSSTSYSLHSFEGERKMETKRSEWVPAASMPLLDGAVTSACGKKS